MAPVNEEVSQKKREEQQRPQLKREVSRILGIVLGCAIYAVGTNIFLRPMHLYSGGFMGYAQLITNLLRDRMNIHPGNLDLAGLIYYLMNLPFLILAYRSLRGKFILKTVFTVTCMTLILTIVPIPAAPVLDEKLANCLVAGIMSGAGVGLILSMGACDGGTDLVGMLLLRKSSSLSIGSINIALNAVFYGLCLILFDVPVAIYSLICSVIGNLVCDKAHAQNINVQALIITKTDEPEVLEVELMGRIGRGVTRWSASGAYTGHEERILMCIISKYEVPRLKSIVHELDPNAFVIINEGVRIEGNFRKKLT